MKKHIKYWQQYLGLDDWNFTTVKISRSQVVDEKLRRGLSFVGVAPLNFITTQFVNRLRC